MVFCTIAVGAIFLLFSRIVGGPDRIPSGTPSVVLVTVVDTEAHYSKEYLQDIKDNRIEYARKHGRSILR